MGRFAVLWLGFKAAADWVIEAVSAALLEDDWLKEDSPKKRIRELTTHHHRVQKSLLLDQDLRGGPIKSISAPVTENLTVGDLLVAPDVVIGDFHDPRLVQILNAVPAEVRAVALAKGEGGSWEQAAQACGLPPEFGEKVRRKFKRLAKQFQERQRDEAPNGDQG